jgi:MFS transporter, Spinster family, sphingosine-1-phosphate transporter
LNREAALFHVADDLGAKESAQPAPISRWALTTFVVLFLMNLLDYTDRNMLYAVLPQVKTALGITNTQAGLLATYFLITYSLVSPVMGWAGDRARRTWLLGLGVGLWSVATIGSGLARNYGQLVLARSLLGIGEATYGVIAPTILLDLFAREQRARVLSTFYLAMPLGSALGMALGGYVATRHSWQWAFFIAGVPGLIASLVAFGLPEPVRGASEGVDPERLTAQEQAGATRADYLDLMVNPSYICAVGGMAAYTFVIGGMLVWIPSFLVRTRGIEQARATTILGLVTLVAAVLGMIVGGWAADRLARTRPKALFVLPGLALLAGIPFVLLCLFTRSEPWIFAWIFLAEMLMFTNTGPCNTIIANVVAPNMRAAAYALAILAIHFLGDIWSPFLIGRVADRFGDPLTMDSFFGRALAAIGATPTHTAGQPNENLTAGLLIVVPALALAGIILLAGARHLPREMAKMLAKLRGGPEVRPGK